MKKTSEERSLGESFALWLALSKPGSAAEICPDENLLAGFVNGRLSVEERELVVRHLASCHVCRGVVRIVAGEPREASRRDRLVERLLRSRVSLGLAAALLLLAAVFAIFVEKSGSSRSQHPDTQALLMASAAKLAEAAPDLFGEFEVLTREERLTGGSSVRRSLDVGLLHPAGKVLVIRPTFVWEPVAGASRYELVLSTNAGSHLWRVETEAPPLEYPSGHEPLSSGASYLWEVKCEGVLGAVRTARVFEVVDDEARGSFARAVSRIHEIVPSGVRDLFLAQFAVRLQYFQEAEQAARSYLAAHLEDAIGQDTLDHILRSIGR